jgi:ABC-2 type transport system ATP-binding protein
MNLLGFRNIKKRFGKNEVLRDISFDVKKGEILGLVGRSAAGKSVLLKILIGMLKSDSGDIFFENKDIINRLDYLRKNTGFASQKNMLFDELTIKENSFYFGSLYGMKRKEIKKSFNEFIDLLRLNGFEDIEIKNLSGGTIKRANILVSLIHNPKLLILDEPTVGLDSLLRDVIWKYIKKINQDGTTILVTSHLLDEIEENCHRIAILKKGKIYAMATTEQFKNKYGKDRNFKEIFQMFMK